MTKIDWDGGPGGATPDPQCTESYKDKESACGLGFEGGFAAALWSWRMRRVRRARASAIAH